MIAAIVTQLIVGLAVATPIYAIIVTLRDYGRDALAALIDAPLSAN